MSAAGRDKIPGDLIGEYLDQLRASLRVAPGEAELVVAEAEDHLRETAAAGMAIGMTEREAQEAAVSSFGPVHTVIRAHAERPGHLVKGRTAAAVIQDLCLAAWKLGSIGLTAVGASGLVVLVMNATLGRAFTGQPPVGIIFPRATCAYWLAGWPGAHTCAQAAMLESSSDAVTLRVGAGIMGVALLEAYAIVRYLLRRRGRGPAVVLAGYFPVLAAFVFGGAALALALAQLTGFTVTAGPGTYLSGSVVAAVVAAGYGIRARSAIRHLMRGWARYVSAR